MKFLILTIALMSGSAFADNHSNIDEVLPTHSLSDFNDADGKPRYSEDSIAIINYIDHVAESITGGDTDHEVDLMVFGASEMSTSEIASFLGNRILEPIVSPDATDLATTMTLLNEIKATMNAANP